MKKVLARMSMTNLGYVCLLMSVAALGIFVYALAVQSPAAALLGAALFVLMTSAVVGFRVGARVRARMNESDIDLPGENIWARPLRREQIDRYLARYRNARDKHEHMLQTVTTPGASAHDVQQAMEKHAA